MARTTWRTLVIGGVICMMGVLAAPAMAATIVFSGAGGAGGDWASAGNWVGGTVPGSADDARIGPTTTNGSPAYIQSNVGSARTLRVGTATNSGGYLQVNSGASLSLVGNSEGNYSAIGYSTSGTVVQSDGAVTFNTAGSYEGLLILGYNATGKGFYELDNGNLDVAKLFIARNAAGASGTFLQTGGTFVLHNGGGDAFRCAATGGGTAVWQMTGGTATFLGGIEVGSEGSATNNSSGTAIISGSAKLNSQNGSGFSVGKSNQGNGLLVLAGSKTGDGTDIICNPGGFNWVKNSSSTSLGTVRFLIDDAAIATPSAMRKIAIGGGNMLSVNQGARLDTGFMPGTTPAPGTWTIVTWTGNDPTITNLGWAAGVDTDVSDGTGWSRNLDTANNALTITYVPEPATMALLAIGGIGMLFSRRRSK